MTKTYGLKQLLSAEPSVDGTMPAALTELCSTLRDSCDFTEDEPQITDEFSDQQDDPIQTFAVKGPTTLKFSTFDYSPEVLVKLKGGTILDGQWAEPVRMQDIHQAIRIVTMTDLFLDFPKCKVMTKFNSKLVKNGLMLLEVTLRVLSPAEGKSAILIGKKTP